ncbi:MAG TPA: rhodanese-like domain-containing protein [Gaiellaceae bacterium]|jgi:rhodanese-related sulfurtransferase
MRSKSADQRLGEARARLTRLKAAEAHSAFEAGAVLVDTRSSDEAREQGAIPGARRHALSVVLWRLDELPRDTRVILICRHGYSSSLAAAQLQELGFRDATDVIDGVEGWLAAGLPVDPWPG